MHMCICLSLGLFLFPDWLGMWLDILSRLLSELTPMRVIELSNKFLIQLTNVAQQLLLSAKVLFKKIKVK